MKLNKKIMIISLIAILVIISGLVLLAADTVPPEESNIQLERFIEMAKNTTSCSEKRNDLFMIDETMVLWVVEGDCPDASYRFYFFGNSPDEVICSLTDSIAGPRLQCNNESLREMFQTMTSHFDTENLGLGSDHQVRRIVF